ncbi:MAG: laminin B domain-containing protein, partial [Verrucomicrobiota bacterium]
WSSPEAYLGDKSQFVGGRLSYRMRVTEITSPFDGCDEFQIHGADIVLGYNTTEVPEVEMKEFHIPLTPSPAWTNVTEDRPATAGDFEKVMSSMTALLIRGEYHSGPDSGWLDKVSLEERR